MYVVVGAGGQQWRYLAEHLEGGGWRGLLVEANAHNVAQQQAAHARAALLHACITYESRLVTVSAAAQGERRPHRPPSLMGVCD